jgi:hypothetical protein
MLIKLEEYIPLVFVLDVKWDLQKVRLTINYISVKTTPFLPFQLPDYNTRRLPNLEVQIHWSLSG